MLILAFGMRQTPSQNLQDVLDDVKNLALLEILYFDVTFHCQLFNNLNDICGGLYNDYIRD